jgi:hypothetical protein
MTKKNKLRKTANTEKQIIITVEHIDEYFQSFFLQQQNNTSSHQL